MRNVVHIHEVCIAHSIHAAWGQYGNKRKRNNSKRGVSNLEETNVVTLKKSLEGIINFRKAVNISFHTSDITDEDIIYAVYVTRID